MFVLNDYKLRPLQKIDLEKVLEWRNSDRIRKNMYTDHIISWDEHLKWYDKVKEDPNMIYLICEYRNKPIGLIYFTDIDRDKCYWGFYLGETNTPRGSGRIMEFLALDYIFSEKAIKNLYCEVFLFNIKVIDLHKKFGFIEERKLPKHVLKNGKYEDVVVMSLSNAVWQGNKLAFKQLHSKNEL